MCLTSPPVKQHEKAKVVSESCLLKKLPRKSLYTKRISPETPEKGFSLLLLFRYSAFATNKIMLFLQGMQTSRGGDTDHGPPFQTFSPGSESWAYRNPEGDWESLHLS